jgi:hypothetical protein
LVLFWDGMAGRSAAMVAAFARREGDFYVWL